MLRAVAEPLVGGGEGSGVARRDRHAVDLADRATARAEARLTHSAREASRKGPALRPV
jgi:hypothetical protein